MITIYTITNMYPLPGGISKFDIQESDIEERHVTNNITKLLIKGQGQFYHSEQMQTSNWVHGYINYEAALASYTVARKKFLKTIIENHKNELKSLKASK